MVWTKQEPTQEGYYWRRRSRLHPAEVVEVAHEDGGDSLVCGWIGGDWTAMVSCGEWAGPIPTPEEPKEQ